MINIQNLIDDAKCLEVIRQVRWPDGVRCPACDAADSTRRGFHTHQPARHRYVCLACGRQFDDLTGTVFEGHQPPVKVWIVCLNLSNQQIAAELDLTARDTPVMTPHLREGVVAKKKPGTLSGGVECDEVDVVAGHTGQPEIVRQLGRTGRRRRLTGARGRGTLEKEKPPSSV